MTTLIPALVIAFASPAATLGAHVISPDLVLAQKKVPSKGGDGAAPAKSGGEGEGEAAGGQQQQEEAPGFGSTLIVMGLIFLFFWLFFIRPQNKQLKEPETLVKGLKKGDAVVTQGGMFGRVTGFDDSTGSVLLEVAKDVRVRVVRNQISRLQQQPAKES